MIRTEQIEVWGWEHAIRGMRNPLNSWDKSDSIFWLDDYGVELGSNDFDLCTRLVKAGEPHRKFCRQIMISLDITAPLYWWKEFDTYKVATTSNSCSTMHKISAKPFKMNDFSFEHLNCDSLHLMQGLLKVLNVYMEDYLKTKDKELWWQMIQLLPSAYNQKRTITMNYETALNILQYRQGHKLDEWNIFCETLLKLPYMKDFWKVVEGK